MERQVRMLLGEQWVPCGQTRRWERGERVSQEESGDPLMLSPEWGRCPWRGELQWPHSQNDFEGNFQHGEKPSCQITLAQLECGVSAHPFWALGFGKLSHLAEGSVDQC